MIDTEGHRFCLFRCHCSLLLLALRSRTAAFGEGSQYLLGADATFGCASNALETYIQRAARLLSICPVTFFSQAPSAGVAGVLPTPATPNSRFPIGAVLPGVVEAMRRVGASMPGEGCSSSRQMSRQLLALVHVMCCRPKSARRSEVFCSGGVSNTRVSCMISKVTVREI